MKGFCSVVFFVTGSMLAKTRDPFMRLDPDIAYIAFGSIHDSELAFALISIGDKILKVKKGDSVGGYNIVDIKENNIVLNDHSGKSIKIFR